MVAVHIVPSYAYLTHFFRTIVAIKTVKNIGQEPEQYSEPLQFPILTRIRILMLCKGGHKAFL
jgi:hypothetical protein